MKGIPYGYDQREEGHGFSLMRISGTLHKDAGFLSGAFSEAITSQSNSLTALLA